MDEDPVLVEKPMRAREMKTNVIPTDVFDTMKYVSTKKTMKHQSLTPELTQPSTKTAELYHEGYVGDQLYLVPDSNLRAMRDRINLRVRPQSTLTTSAPYTDQNSFELNDYDHFRSRINTLLEKLSDEESQEGQEEEEELLKKEEEHADEEKEIEEGTEVEEEEKTQEHEPPLPPPKSTPNNVLRFLISGHIRDGKQHIYIIQDYRGGEDLFSDQKGDFYTKEKHDEVDFSLSGRFYNKKILEEYNGKPVALNIGSHRILIDERTSKVHENYFKQVYKFITMDITLKGEFITSKITKTITPFLSLNFKHKTSAEPHIKIENDYIYTNRFPIECYHKPGLPFSNYKTLKSKEANLDKKDINTYRDFSDEKVQTKRTALILESVVEVMPPHRIKNSLCQSRLKMPEEERITKVDETNLKTTVRVKPYTIYTSDHRKAKKVDSIYSNGQYDREKNISQENLIVQEETMQPKIKNAKSRPKQE